MTESAAGAGGVECPRAEPEHFTQSVQADLESAAESKLCQTQLLVLLSLIMLSQSA